MINKEAVKAIEETLENLENLGKIKRNGIIISCDQEMVDTLLFFSKEFTEGQLTRMRNNYVYVLADKIEQARDENNYAEVDRFYALMTVVTGSIDRRIMNGWYIEQRKEG